MLEMIRFTLLILKKKPARTFFSVIQITFAVWLLSLVLSLNFQSRVRIQDVVNDLGGSLARINLTNPTTNYYYNLNARHCDYLRELEGTSFVESIFFLKFSRIAISYDTDNFMVNRALFTNASREKDLGLELIKGVYLSEQDFKSENKVILLEEGFSKTIFASENPLGKKIEVNMFTWDNATEVYEVIGIYKEPSPYLKEFYDNHAIILPAFRKDLSNYRDFYLVSSPGNIYGAVSEAKSYLAEVINDQIILDTDYFIDTFRWTKEFAERILLVLIITLAVSLLISSVGILSFIMVGVEERTREIGLRQTLGATRLDVILQILNEAFVLTVLGGLTGVIIACLTGSRFFTFLYKNELYPDLGNISGISLKGVIWSFFIILVINQVIAFYPAFNSAKRNHIEATKD